MDSVSAVEKYRTKNPMFREMWDRLTLAEQITIEGLVASALHDAWKERWDRDIERVYEVLDGR